MRIVILLAMLTFTSLAFAGSGSWGTVTHVTTQDGSEGLVTINGVASPEGSPINAGDDIRTPANVNTATLQANDMTTYNMDGEDHFIASDPAGDGGKKTKNVGH